MSSRELRLRNKSEFRAAMAGERKISRPSVLARAVRRDGGGPTRVGFVATKRIGGAVQRNKALRRMRDAVRNCPVQTEGWDVVFVARTGVLETKSSELSSSICQIMEELGRE